MEYSSWGQLFGDTPDQRPVHEGTRLLFRPLDPIPFAKLVGEIRNMSEVMGLSSLELSAGERVYRLKYKKWLIANKDLPKGHHLSEEDLTYQRLEEGQPIGSSISLSDSKKYILTKSLEKGKPITMNHIQLKVATVLACRGGIFEIVCQTDAEYREKTNPCSHN